MAAEVAVEHLDHMMDLELPDLAAEARDVLAPARGAARKLVRRARNDVTPRRVMDMTTMEYSWKRMPRSMAVEVAAGRLERVAPDRTMDLEKVECRRAIRVAPEGARGVAPGLTGVAPDLDRMKVIRIMS